MSKKYRTFTGDDQLISINLLNGWSGKLSWDRFIAILEMEIGYKYSRMHFRNYPKIESAFTSAKNRLKGVTDDALTVALAKINDLEKSLLKANAENERLKNQFVIWQYNAVSRGLSEELLNLPIAEQR